MNILHSIIIFFICHFSFLYEKEENKWDKEMYLAYDFKSFAKYSPANKKINIQSIDYALLDASVFYETNRQRNLNRLPLFKYSLALEKAAIEHSNDMVEYDFFSHTSTLAGKKYLSDRMKKVGLINVRIGENIAETFSIDLINNKPFYTPSQNGGYFSYEYKGKPIETHTYLSFAKRVVKQWMNSPGHRRNILDSDYSYLGCGCIIKKTENMDQVPRIFSTQNFSSADANYNLYTNEINYRLYKK